jgi:Ankyrin repeat
LRYYHCKLRSSNLRFAVLTSVRPSQLDRSELLSIKETVFHEVDESVLSIVPSCLSISESDAASIESRGSADLWYTPFAFENALFTSYVYKRNFRAPKIRRLFRKREVEISNGSAASNADAVSICATPQYIPQTTATEQDEPSVIQDEISTQNPTLDPGILPVRGEQQSSTLSATTSYEGSLGESARLNITQENSQENSGGYTCALPIVESLTPCYTIESQEPNMVHQTKVDSQAEVACQIISEAQPKSCEVQHGNGISLAEEPQALSRITRKPVFRGKRTTRVSTNRGYSDLSPPQITLNHLSSLVAHYLSTRTIRAIKEGNYIESIQYLRQGIDIMTLFTPDAGLSESNVCCMLQELQNRDRTFFVAVMQRLAFQLGNSGIKNLVDRVSLSGFGRIEDIESTSSAVARTTTSRPLRIIFEDAEIVFAASFRENASSSGMLCHFPTVLQLACVARKPEVVKYLLSMGAPELPMHWPEDPFILATKRRCIPILELFFKMADKHVSTHIRNLSLMMVVNKDCTLSDHWTDPLANDHVRCAEDVAAVSILLENGASPLAKSLHSTPVLHIAIRAAETGDIHSLEIIRLLILHGADVNEGDHRYNLMSPLFLAISMSNLALVEILLKNGANILEARDAREFLEVMKRLKESLDPTEVEISELLRANPRIGSDEVTLFDPSVWEKSVYGPVMPWITSFVCVGVYPRQIRAALNARRTLRVEPLR